MVTKLGAQPHGYRFMDTASEYWNCEIAASKIQDKANYSIQKIGVVGGTIYYTDYSDHMIQECEHEPNPNYNPNTDDPLMSTMFYCEYPEYNSYGSRILSPDVLNFYLTNLKNRGNNNCPAGKDLVSYLFYYAYYVSIPIREEFHYGYVNYAIRHVKPNPPIK
ncbi:MAG: hypothetical protein FWG84_00750 [Bacteroidales bacterium]|nr:hypothetical protein [Bacteroidales bacterium]